MTTVRIEIYPEFAAIAPPIREVSDDLAFSVFNSEFFAGAIRLQPRSESYVVQVNDDAVQIPANFASRAIRLMRKLGHTVAVIDRRPVPPIVRRPHSIQVTPSESIAAAVATNHSGIVLSESSRQMQIQVGECLSLLDRVIVPLRTRELCRKWTVALQEFVGGEVDELASGSSDSPCRVWVTTYETACKTSPDPSRTVVVPQAEHALATRFDDFMAPLGGVRCIGFLGSAVRLEYNDRLRLEFQFGDIIFPPRSLEGVNGENCVWMLNSPAGNPESSDDPLDAKRRRWSDQPRNEYVADLARRIASGRADQVAGLMPATTRVQLESIQSLQRVAVIVEGLDHAEHLSQHLVGWPILARRDSSAPATADNACCIVTYSALDHQRRIDADIFLRADVGIGSLDPWRLRRLAQVAPQSPLFVFDVGDNASDALTRTRRRTAAYRADGWKVVERSGVTSCPRAIPIFENGN